MLKTPIPEGLGMASATFAEGVIGFAATPSPPPHLPLRDTAVCMSLRGRGAWLHSRQMPYLLLMPIKAGSPRDACNPRHQHHEVSGLPSSPQQSRGPRVTHPESCELCKPCVQHQ